MNMAKTFQLQLLFTLDMVSLYTSIHHGDGLRALSFFLDHCPPEACYPPTPGSTGWACPHLEHIWVWWTNLPPSQWRRHGYQNGWPIHGPPWTPHIGILYRPSTRTVQEARWWRLWSFVDVWVCSLDFIHFVQNFHPSIKFTYKISPVSVEFWYILVNIKCGQFTISVFYKPTDAHSCPYFHSSHHPNTKASIPYSQFLRLWRLCSDKEDFLLQVSRMSEFFSAQGYPTSVTENALRCAKQISRACALNPAAPVTNERPIISRLYHPHNLPDCRILRSDWHILQNNTTVATTFCDRPLVAFKKDQNLERSEPTWDSRTLPPQ